MAPAAPEHFRFLSQKIPKSFQNDSGILQELSGMCRNQFDLMVYPETTFRYHRNLSDDLSLRYDSAVRNFFGEFLSDSLSSIQQIHDPYACDPIGSVKYRHRWNSFRSMINIGAMDTHIDPYTHTNKYSSEPPVAMCYSCCFAICYKYPR